MRNDFAIVFSFFLRENSCICGNIVQDLLKVSPEVLDLLEIYEGLLYTLCVMVLAVRALRLIFRRSWWTCRASPVRRCQTSLIHVGAEVSEHPVQAVVNLLRSARCLA